MKDLEDFAIDLSVKTNHNLALLCFSTLALSIQFSTTHGSEDLYILFFSWFLLLLSCICGGWVVLKLPIFYRINSGVLKVEEYLRIFNNQDFLNSIRENRAFTENNTTWTQDKVEETIRKEKEKLEFGLKNMDDIKSKLGPVTKIQIMAYLLGIILNIIFISINL